MWTIITASSVEDAEKKITKLYRDSGVSLGELLDTVEIRGLSLNDIAEVYANLRLEIDGDSVMRIEEDGTYHTLSDDSLSRKIKEEWKGILAPLVKGRNGLTPECIGRKTFGDTVDITDPGYDKDVKYRKNGVKIVPGTYECVAWRHNFPYEGRDDIRVCIAGIYLTGVDKNDVEWSPEEFADIGVDAGLAGFFQNKPDYTADEWRNLCDKLGYSDDAWILPEGFCTSSGFGDGRYPVYVARNDKDEIVALEIEFINEGELED